MKTNPLPTFGLGLAVLLAGFTATALGQSCVAPPSELVSWWPGDQHALDLAGTNHGTLRGGMGCAAGNVGPAFSFDGTNDFARIPDSPSLQMPDAPFSIALWFRRENTTYGQVLLSKGFSDANEEYSINVEPDGLIYWDYGGLDAYVNSIPTNLPAGSWQHLVVTYSPTASPRGSVYLNGSSLPLAASGPGAHIVSSGSALYFGQQNNGAMYYNGRVPFQGQLDEVALFSRELAAEEIASLYAAGSAGLCQDFQFIAPLQDGVAYLGVSNAVLTVTASGRWPVTYQWWRGTTALAGQTNAALTLSSPAWADAGNYDVVVTDTTGATLTNASPATLAVKLCADTVPAPVAWWSGDGHAFDLARTNHGILTNGTAFAPGRVDQAFSFDGVDDYVMVPATGLAVDTNDFTLQGWVQTTSTKTWNVIVGFDTYAPGVYVMGDGTLKLYPLVSSIDTGLNDGQWHHFAVVRRAEEITYYQDGAPAGTAPYSTALNPSVMTIGWDYWGGDQFQGLIDELAWYDRALSTNDIATIAAAGSAGLCKELKILAPP